MDKSDRRTVSLSGLGLIGAGAVLGLALATPDAAAPGQQAAPPQSQSQSAQTQAGDEDDA